MKFKLNLNGIGQWFVLVISILFGISLLLWIFDINALLLKISIIITIVLILTLVVLVGIELTQDSVLNKRYRNEKENFKGFIISDKTSEKINE